jgi:hypothetical protein
MRFKEFSASAYVVTFQEGTGKKLQSFGVCGSAILACFAWWERLAHSKNAKLIAKKLPEEDDRDLVGDPSQLFTLPTPD